MKANEAQEKIYIPRLEGNETFVHEWSATKFRKYFNREVAENVEYTRTDSLLEKVYNWLKNYAFVDDNKNVNLPILLHDFLKDSRNF